MVLDVPSPIPNWHIFALNLTDLSILIRNQFQYMDCIPPWLSPNNQCKANISTKNYTKEEISQMIKTKFQEPKLEKKRTEVEKNAKILARK